MSADDVGLPFEQREHITGMLEAALVAIGEPGSRPDAQHAADIIVQLITDVDAYARDAGLFELAAACCIVLGGPPQIPGVGEGLGPLRYIGNGPNEAASYPGTPAQYAMAHFGTAILAHDRPAAWNLWAPMAPGDAREVQPMCGDFLAGLIRNAWSSYAGGGTRLLVQTGTRWPPVCDFCCGPPASWMWKCRGGDITLRTLGGAPGGTTVRLDDMEFWYACALCRPLIARPRPAWEQVFARHRRERPDANREAIFTMYWAYAAARRTVKPVRLPATRPTPTPGRI